MQVDLVKYLTERVADDEAKSVHYGPVITIAREYGCPSKLIACRLAEELSNKVSAKGRTTPWKFVTKEILWESARELQIDPARIKYVLDNERGGIFDNVLLAQFSKYYKSDRKIRNTIAKVIRNMAREGHVIIVGRGGVAITRDIPESLHIMLKAPLEWRIARISENYHITPLEARKSALAVDLQRKEFRESFRGKNNDYTWFDLTLNCMTLSIDEIVGIIVNAARIKHLV